MPKIATLNIYRANRKKHKGIHSKNLSRLKKSKQYKKPKNRGGK